MKKIMLFSSVALVAGLAIGYTLCKENMATTVRASYEEGEKSVRQKHGFASQVLFVHRDVKAGDVLTKEDLAMRDYIYAGVSDRLLQSADLQNVLGRKMRVDLKARSVLLKTDIQQ